jgi:DNA-directed RNA polymerase specialized sigma24 family protein
MKDTGSLSLLLEQLKAGQQAALGALWERSFGRLVDQAHQQLRGRPLGVADAEDVALSAFDSFHRGVGRGRFPRLEDRNDLWQVLLLLLRQKAINLLKHETRQKRGGGKVQQFSALPETDSQSSGHAAMQCAGAVQTPAVTAEAEEEFRHLLDMLGDDELRMIALCKMESYSNEEIAGRLDCSLATVERRLNLIRKIWSRRIDERR